MKKKCALYIDRINYKRTLQLQDSRAMSVFVERASGARRLHIFWAKLSADFEYVRRMLVIDA